MARFPTRRGARRGDAGRRPAGVAGPRLQPAGAQPAAGGASHRRAARRAGAVRPADARGAARRRAVHGPGGRGARVRRAGRRGRHERPAGARAGSWPATSASMDAAELQALADAAVPPDQPGIWTHALMDVGATLCRPRRPGCGVPGATVVPVRRARSDGVASAGRSAKRPRRARAAPLRSRPRRAGCAAGSSTACGRPERGVGRSSTARSATTTEAGRRRRARGAGPRRPGRARGGSATPMRRTGRARLPTRAVTSATLRWRCPRPPDPSPRMRPRRCPPTIRPSSRWTCAACAATGRPRPTCPPISAETMTGADRRAQALGVPEERLMEHAGTAVAAAVRALAVGPRPMGDRARSSSCAGPATTAATGSSPRAAWRSPGAPVDRRARRRRTPARAARRGPELGPPRPRRRDRQGPPRRSPATWRCSARASRRRRSSSTRCSGTGVRGALREPIRSAVEVIGRARAAGVPVVAVDTPTAVDLSSGEPSDPAVRADLTVTFHRPKTGLLTRRGAALRGQGPGRADRHPGRGGPWLSRDASDGSRAGARSLLVAVGVVAVVLGAAVAHQPPADERPGGRLPHAARHRRPDRRDRLAAVADRAPAAGLAER